MACNSCNSNNITVTINGVNSCSTCNDCNASCTTCNACSTTLSTSTCSQCSTECLDNYNTSCIVYNGADGPCATFENIENTPLNDILSTIFTSICALEADPVDLCVALGAVSIDCLSDVNTTGIANGNFLKYVTDTWVPADLVIADITDIVLTAPADGDTLQFNGTNWINVPGDDCSIQYTQAGIVAAAGANTLLDACEVKLYDTTNYNSVSLSTAKWNIGAIFSVLTSNKFSLTGNAGYYIPDYSGTDTNYNDGVIFAQTGVHPTGDALGIWNSTLLPVIGDCCVWGGFNWINVNGNVGAATDQFTLNVEWTKLTKTVSNALSKGYRDKIDMIKISFSYSTGVVTLLERKDNLGNVVQGENNILRFPWGNPNITNCLIDTSVTLDTTMINETDTIDSKVCISGLSTFTKTIDTATAAYFAANTLVLTTYPHVGIVTLNNSGGAITVKNITNHPIAHNVRFYTDLANTIFDETGSIRLKLTTGATITLIQAMDFVELNEFGGLLIEDNQGLF